jgi:hypothetical protein
MPSSNPTIPVNGFGVLGWANDSNNWRKADGDWLQQRGIIRWADAAARTAATAENRAIGSIAYLSSPGKFTANIGGTYKDLIAASNIMVSSDSTSAVALKHLNSSTDGAGTVSVQIEPNRVQIAGMTTGSQFVAGRLTTSNASVGVTSSDGTLIGLSKDTAVLGGALRVGGAFATDGAVTVGAGLTSTAGTTTLGTTTVGALTATSVTAPTHTATTVFSGPLSGDVTSVGTSKFGQLTLNGSTITNSTATTPSSPNSVQISSTSGILFQTNPGNTSGTQRVLLNDGSATSAQVATVVVSTLAPVAQDYPEGCLWIQI